MISLQPRPILDKFDKSDPATWIATWGGTGFIKPAPGTWGSLAALPFAAFLLYLDTAYLALGIAALTPLAFYATKKFTRAAGEGDSSMIVVDEVLGQWITLLPALLSPLYFIAGFLLFRFFDILKPWPVNWLDKNMKGASGVIADDVMAGLYAAACIAGMRYYGLG